MSFIERLAPLRAQPGTRLTTGLDDATLERLAAGHPALVAAIDAAAAEFERVRAGLGDLLALDERAQIEAMQDGFVNFYADDAVTPYVALAARGAWVVTLKGAVLYDAGGYGMLGFGHTPEAVMEAMAAPQVMANVMTPSLSQQRFIQALRKEIGHRRGGCPYSHFMCLNSGSEAVGLAARIADVNAKLQTDPGARHAGAKIKRVVVKGSFHGRTDRPGLYSDSSRKTYMQHLASYRGEDTVIAIAPYDEDALKRVFAEAEQNHWFIEAVFLEPVMGEGDPGRSVPPSFYALARELTRQHGSLLLLDSIQAGLRAHGVLSIVDYPGFEGLDVPDMETYSKALNAAQFPLGAGRDRTCRAAVPQGHLRQHHDFQPAGVGCGLRHAVAAHSPGAREHPRARRGSRAQAGTAQDRPGRADHQGPGHRPAVLLRAGPAVQVLRHRLHRGMAAQPWHQCDPWRRELAAVHPALRHGRRGAGPAGRPGWPRIEGRSAPGAVAGGLRPASVRV